MEDSERTQLQTLDAAIANQQQRLTEAKEGNASQDELIKIQEAKNTLNQQKETLVLQLRAKYPGYYSLWDQLKNDESHSRMQVLMCELMPDEEHSATNLEMCQEQLADVLKKIADLENEFEGNPEKFTG